MERRRPRPWYVDPRLVVALAHTALVTGVFLVVYDPSHDIHIHPCCFVVDLPGWILWYYGGRVIQYIPAIPDAYHLKSAIMQWVGITVGGGLQWVLLVWGLMAWRSRKRAGEYSCKTCGYNLTGNVSGVCPECGQSISAMRSRGSG